jgi:PBP1b-binding outer membrane lipoprotein LpoB
VALPLCLLTLLASGCASAPARPTFDVRAAQAHAAKRPKLLASDLEAMAQAVAKRCLGGPWLATLTQQLGRAPMLRLVDVRDATAEQLDTQTLSRQLEMRLLRSGKLKLVGGPTEGAERPSKRAAADVVAQLSVRKEQPQEHAAGPLDQGPVRYSAQLSITRVRDSRPLCRARHVISKR